MGYFLEAIGVLVIFASVLFLAVVTTRLIVKKARSLTSGRYISIVDSISLGFDKQVHLIKVADKYVLVATSGKTVTCLALLEIDKLEAEETGEQPAGEGINFRDLLNRYLLSHVGKRQGSGNADKSEGKASSPKAGTTFGNNLMRLKSLVKGMANKSDGGDGDTNDEGEENP